MRALPVALLAALVVVSAAAARNPRLEHVAIVPADQALAAGAVLRSADLGTTWVKRPLKDNGNTAPDCPWQNYSKYTITGQAQSQFARQGASVLSRVELYPSRAQVRGDFDVDARAGTARCEGEALRKEFAKETKSTVTLASASQGPGPKIGERSVAFHIVLRMHRGGKVLPVYIDLIAFLRDRAAASVFVVAPGARPKGLDVLARAIDARLQRAA